MKSSAIIFVSALMLLLISSWMYNTFLYLSRLQQDNKQLGSLCHISASYTESGMRVAGVFMILSIIFVIYAAFNLYNDHK